MCSLYPRFALFHMTQRSNVFGQQATIQLSNFLEKTHFIFIYYIYLYIWFMVHIFVYCSVENIRPTPHKYLHCAKLCPYYTLLHKLVEFIHIEWPQINSLCACLCCVLRTSKRTGNASSRILTDTNLQQHWARELFCSDWVTKKMKCDVTL